MGCVTFKTTQNTCSAFKHFQSEPELSSILHTGCYCVETVLTSPYGINFYRCYQFYMNQKPPLLSSLGMVWIERLDVPKSNKSQTTGGFFVPPFENFLKTSLTQMLHPKTMSRTCHLCWDGTNPLATSHPRASPSAVHTTSSSTSLKWWWPQSQSDVMEVTKLSTPPEGTPGRKSQLQRQSWHECGPTLTFSTLLNHNFTTLQDHKSKRIWERKEREGKCEQEH